MKKYALIVILLLMSQSLISETIFVKGKVLNFREEPNGKKIGVLYSGTEIEQVYNKGEWARVKVYGWVYKPLTESKEAKNLQKSEKKTEKSVYKKKWYQGGTLHKATIGEWKTATQQNKLATSSDWLAATEWKGHLNSPSDFDKLKICAQKLVNAVDKTVIATDKLDSSSVTEVAAMLIKMSYDLKPQYYK